MGQFGYQQGVHVDCHTKWTNCLSDKKGHVGCHTKLDQLVVIIHKYIMLDFIFNSAH